MKTKDKPKVKVGDYEVVRRGSRLVALQPERRYSWGETIPERVWATFDRATANTLFALPDELRKDKARIPALKKQVRALQVELLSLQAGRKIKGFRVTALSSGLKFGCTKVSKKKLDAIKKLLD